LSSSCFKSSRCLGWWMKSSIACGKGAVSVSIKLEAEVFLQDIIQVLDQSLEVWTTNGYPYRGRVGHNVSLHHQIFGVHYHPRWQLVGRLVAGLTHGKSWRVWQLTTTSCFNADLYAGSAWSSREISTDESSTFERVLMPPWAEMLITCGKHL
jgi:hypothetical protein